MIEAPPACQDCVTANKRAKAQGFVVKDRAGAALFACYTHAAVNLNDWLAANRAAVGPCQGDLFGVAA